MTHVIEGEGILPDFTEVGRVLGELLKDDPTFQKK
jgi:hypothetical protein